MTPEYVQDFLDRGEDTLGLHLYPDPEDVADPPAVVIWPAMGVPARYYRPFAARLRAHGLGVVVADLRGTGSSTPRAGRASRYGYRELTGDIGAVLGALSARLDGRRRLLLGHSLGGQACLMHLALSEQETPPGAGVDGLVLVGTGLPYWRSYTGSRRFGVLPFTQGIGVTAALLKVWPGWGFGGRQAGGVIRDWAYTARTGLFPALDGVDTESALRHLTTPVLAISVDADQYTPEGTVDHLVGKLTAAAVRREHYTTTEAGAPVDHFTWVRASDGLAARVAAFAAAPARGR